MTPALYKLVNPYIRLARLNNPIGIWLLLLPCWWSLCLATPPTSEIKNYVLFAIGAVILRAAGCTINDIIDKDFDKKVIRTSKRPLASGEITIRQALYFSLILLVAGFVILIQFNQLTILLGLSSLVLILIYPFLKRITYWPQAFLGLTFNWGALLGWTSVHNGLSTIALLLYFAGFFWTLGYDTIYAHQDTRDDIQHGVMSTAIKFGETTKKWLTGFFSLSLTLFFFCGYLKAFHWCFYVGLLLGYLHLLWQIKTLDISSPKNCQSRFESNRDFGLIILLSMFAANFFS